MSTGFRNYVKRYRLECWLNEPIEPVTLPEGYRFIAWQPELWVNHAEVKVAAFANTIDARIFPNLGQIQGCMNLMQEIAEHPAFFPEATMIIRHGRSDVACVQCLCEHQHYAMIQNLAVHPLEQGQGLGKVLLGHTLRVLQDFGIREVRLEVSAKNEPAIRLYNHFGFQRYKTLYRETIPPQDDYTI